MSLYRFKIGEGALIKLFYTTTDLTQYVPTQVTTRIPISITGYGTSTVPQDGDLVVDDYGTFAVVTGEVTVSDNVPQAYVKIISHVAQGVYKISNQALNATVGGAYSIDDANISPSSRLVQKGDVAVDENGRVGVFQHDYDGTGNVITTIYAAGVYQKPSGGIPKTDLAQAVQNSLDKAESALQSVTKNDVGLGNVDNVKQYSASNPPPYPVTSVNNKTGAVSLSKSDVGLSNVDNVKQYSASNPPPYPVRSVNGKTGAVSLSASDVGAATAAQGAKADSAAQLNKAQTWTQEQRFNAGFTALNGNFSFSDTTNIGMELGRRDGTGGTPYIDFHTDGSSSTDYNSRLLATGNQLQVTASGGFSVNGHNIEELDMVVDSGNAITMTAPASGDTVQAPANGWFCLLLHSTGSGVVSLRAKRSDGADKWGAINLATSYNAGWPTYFLPVKSEDYVMMTFTNATANRLQFIRSTSLSDI